MIVLHYKDAIEYAIVLGGINNNQSPHILFSHRIKLVAILSTMAGGETVFLPASITFIL